MVMGIILFIQSELFAGLLKNLAKKHLPADLGVEGEFKELSVKLLPPGIVIHHPSLSLKEKNFANLPGGTKIEADALDLTFQFFQLLTGSVDVNAFAISGASLTLDLDEKFFAEYERNMMSKQKSSLISMPSLSLSWENLVRFKFRSVSILDSKVDIRMHRGGRFIPIGVQAFTKELTVGRSTVDGYPAYDIAADFQNAQVQIGNFSQNLTQFQSSLEVSSKGVAVHTLSMQEDDVNFHANGQISGNVLNPDKLMAKLNYIIKGSVPKLVSPQMLGSLVHVPKGAHVDGNLSIEGDVQADLLNLQNTMATRFSLKVANPVYSAWNAKELEVHGEWKSPTLAMTGATVDFGDGKVSFSRIDYDSREELETVEVRANLQNTDLRKIMGPALDAVYPLHMFLTGNVSTDINLRKGFRLNGNADLQVAEFSFDNQKPGKSKPLMQLLHVPSLRVKSLFSLDEKGFQFHDTEARIKDSKLQAHGKVDSKGIFDIDIQGPVNLAEVGKLSAFDIRGEGDLHWTITGKKPDVLFTFEPHIKNARYLDMNLGDVSGKIIYNDGPENLTLRNIKSTIHRTEFSANGTVDLNKTDEINIDVRMPNGTIPDLAHVFDSFIQKAVPWFPWELNGKMTGLIRVSGTTDTQKLSVMGDMNVSNIEYQGEIFRGGTMHAGFRHGSYVAENIDLIKHSGRITGNIVYGSDDALHMDLKTHHATTVDVDTLAAFGVPYLAPLDFAVNCNGPWGALNGFVEASVGSGVIKGYPIGSSQLRIDMGAGRWKGTLSIFGSQFESDFDIGWKTGSDSRIGFKANSFRFHPLLIALNTNLASDSGLFGDLSGDADFTFKTGAMSRLSGTFALDSFQLRRTGYTFFLESPVHFNLHNGDYEFKQAAFLSANGGSARHVQVKGQVSSGTIAYDIQGSTHLRLLEFLTSEIAGSNGTADVSASLTGKADMPDLDGSIKLENAYLRLNSMDQPFEDVQAGILLQNNVISFKQFSSKFAGGAVRGAGRAEIYFTKAPDLNFSAEIDNAKVKVYPVTYARSTGKLQLKGTHLPYDVTGDIKVAEALIRENFDLTEGSRILRSSKFLPTEGIGAREHSLFNLNINVSADRGIFVKNSLFDAELRGQLKVINSLRTPRLLGTVDILSGKLLFKDSYFTIQNGTMHFNNPSAIDPEFDFSGTTEVKGYKIQLVAGGAVSDYKFNLTSQPPLSQNDIVNLLTLGVTSTEYQNISKENRDAYSRDELYNLLFSQSGINRDLQEKFGLRLRVDQSQLPTPTNVFRANGADETVAPKVVLQKEITKKLTASVGSTVGVGDTQEKSANLEYDLHKNWSVMGTYDDQRDAQLNQSRTSVGADLKFKMRFK